MTLIAISLILTDQSVSTTPQEEEERTDESLKGIVLFKVSSYKDDQTILFQFVINFVYCISIQMYTPLKI